jgi:hypothetical protein
MFDLVLSSSMPDARHPTTRPCADPDHRTAPHDMDVRCLRSLTHVSPDGASAVVSAPRSSTGTPGSRTGSRRGSKPLLASPSLAAVPRGRRGVFSGSGWVPVSLRPTWTCAGRHRLAVPPHSGAPAVAQLLGDHRTGLGLPINNLDPVLHGDLVTCGDTDRAHASYWRPSSPRCSCRARSSARTARLEGYGVPMEHHPQPVRAAVTGRLRAPAGSMRSRADERPARAR